MHLCNKHILSNFCKASILPKALSIPLIYYFLLFKLLPPLGRVISHLERLMKGKPRYESHSMYNYLARREAIN